MIRFTYALSGSGWAEATLASNNQHVTLRVSYLSDALDDLARAVLAILGGAPSAHATWAEEPGEHRLLLVRSGDRITVQVRYFTEIYSDEPDDKGLIRFTASDDARTFAEVVRDQLSAVLTTWGEQGYRAKWAMHDFPSAAYQRLVALLGAGRGGDTETASQDWRLTGQEEYLTGVSLRWRAYTRSDGSRDQDLCEFCWAPFIEPGSAFISGETRTAGFAVDAHEVREKEFPEGYYWICALCYEDVKDRFGWTVSGE